MAQKLASKRPNNRIKCGSAELLPLLADQLAAARAISLRLQLADQLAAASFGLLASCCPSRQNIHRSTANIITDKKMARCYIMCGYY